MKHLEPPDTHYLLAAQGWLELGNQAEAFHELDKIAPAVRMHPDVVKMRWQIYGKAQPWRTVLDIAKTICRLEPISLGQSKPPQAAVPLSVSENQVRSKAAAIRLPDLYAIPYNLACYACQLGNVSEAWEWFQMAIEMSDFEELRRLALNDPDLAPLWDRIRGL
jgi:hypothetical protein